MNFIKARTIHNTTPVTCYHSSYYPLSDSNTEFKWLAVDPKQSAFHLFDNGFTRLINKSALCSKNCSPIKFSFYQFTLKHNLSWLYINNFDLRPKSKLLQLCHEYNICDKNVTDLSNENNKFILQFIKYFNSISSPQQQLVGYINLCDQSELAVLDLMQVINPSLTVTYQFEQLDIIQSSVLIQPNQTVDDNLPNIFTQIVNRYVITHYESTKGLILIWIHDKQKLLDFDNKIITTDTETQLRQLRLRKPQQLIVNADLSLLINEFNKILNLCLISIKSNKKIITFLLDKFINLMQNSQVKVLTSICYYRIDKTKNITPQYQVTFDIIEVELMLSSLLPYILDRMFDKVVTYQGNNQSNIKLMIETTSNSIDIQLLDVNHNTKVSLEQLTSFDMFNENFQNFCSKLIDDRK